MISTPTKVFAGIVIAWASIMTAGFIFAYIGLMTHINVFLEFGIFGAVTGFIGSIRGAKSITGKEQSQGMTVIPTDNNALVNAYVNEQVKNRNKAFG